MIESILFVLLCRSSGPVSRRRYYSPLAWSPTLDSWTFCSGERVSSQISALSPVASPLCTHPYLVDFAEGPTAHNRQNLVALVELSHQFVFLLLPMHIIYNRSSRIILISNLLSYWFQTQDSRTLKISYLVHFFAPPPQQLFFCCFWAEVKGIESLTFPWAVAFFSSSFSDTAVNSSWLVEWLRWCPCRPWQKSVWAWPPLSQHIVWRPDSWLFLRRPCRSCSLPQPTLYGFNSTHVFWSLGLQFIDPAFEDWKRLFLSNVVDAQGYLRIYLKREVPR